MIGTSSGTAALILKRAIVTESGLTPEELTSPVDNHTIAATSAKDASFQDTTSRLITPIPLRKTTLRQ